MSLSCALAGIPGLIAYRAHPLTYFLGRILVKVPYLGMANILIPDNPPYSEFIQHNANGRNLSQSMVNIFRDTQARNQAERNAKKLLACLTSAKQKSTVDWLVQEASLT
jgi:lipid-A-disaccharide synthase